jgi:hypothetical protein
VACGVIGSLHFLVVGPDLAPWPVLGLIQKSFEKFFKVERSPSLAREVVLHEADRRVAGMAESASVQFPFVAVVVYLGSASTDGALIALLSDDGLEHLACEPNTFS